MKNSCDGPAKGMKSLVVLNGEYYCGENTQENKLVFLPERAKAVVSMIEDLGSLFNLSIPGLGVARFSYKC